MASRNDITNDPIISKTNSKAYEDNYDKIFRKKSEEAEKAFTTWLYANYRIGNGDTLIKLREDPLIQEQFENDTGIHLH